jgi:type II secretory pathway pseudopilin PulG
MGAAVGSGPEQPGVNVTPSYSNYHAMPPAELKTGLAITSLVLGILNLVPCVGIFLIPTIVGITISGVALNKTMRFPRQYGGKPFAIAGLVTNLVAVVVMVPMIAAIAIPNLLASRRAANEGSAQQNLRTIYAAEQTYRETTGKGEYGTLANLRSAALISDDLASGVRWGYQYKVEMISSAGFEVMAVPTEYGSSGSRSFFIDETGVLRGDDLGGREATRSTPTIDANRDYPERRSETRRSSNADDE